MILPAVLLFGAGGYLSAKGYVECPDQLGGQRFPVISKVCPRRVHFARTTFAPNSTLLCVVTTRLSSRSKALVETYDKASYSSGLMTVRRFGGAATNRQVKRLGASGELAGHRMLHFASHGALAGQPPGGASRG